MPGLCRIQFLTVLKWRTLPMLNKKEGDKNCFGYCQVHTHANLFGFQLLPPALQLL